PTRRPSHLFPYTTLFRSGEIVGLIGPNGAGKTTLLNVVSGARQPDGGSVRVFGEEVADLPAEYRSAFGLARSFQDARLFPGLTRSEEHTSELQSLADLVC